MRFGPVVFWLGDVRWGVDGSQRLRFVIVTDFPTTRC